MARRLTFSHPMGTVAPVGALLRVGERLDDLVDGLADRLRVPLPDPFAPELIVVPSAGVRHWLAQRLAERLGGPLSKALQASIVGRDRACAKER